MMDQFTDIKTEHPDSVLFFRMGDFYELFHEDAVTGSEVLGLALTSRDKKADKPIKMAGFPWHALEDNIRTMLKAGHKVTVAEQEQELREGAKLLERVVTRVYTPGSLYEESLLGTEERSLLLSICLGKNSIGIGIIDASTGQAWASNLEGDDRFSRALDEVLRWRPTEIVVAPKDADDATLRALIHTPRWSHNQPTQGVGSKAEGPSYEGPQSCRSRPYRPRRRTTCHRSRRISRRLPRIDAPD